MVEECLVVRTPLTHREDEVLHLAITGLSNDQIAARLAISRRTVEAHMRTLFRKTGVTRRTQLAALYQAGVPLVGEVPEPVTPHSDTGPDIPPSRRHGDLADCQRQLQVSAAAIRGLVDRQFPLFEERVELTVVVGEQDGQDAIIERRWTTPRPYLVYRILSPIVTWPEGPIEADDLALACQVDGQDTQVDVHAVRDVDNRPLVMVLFQPGLQADTEWVLRYRSPQLWAPLRGTGEDTLTWATATLDQRHQPTDRRQQPTIRELVLKVVFPAGWTGERVSEQSNLGVVHTDRLPSGQTRVTWHQEAPDAAFYHWTLHGSLGT